MRKGLTLIELIFSMVIIAVVFTVIPKLIQSFATTNEVVIKEDALYNALSLMGIITALPWDENNTEEDYILNVKDGNVSFDCNVTTGYRIGGFVGGRNCIGVTGPSHLRPNFNDGDGNFNDIDDFDRTSTSTDAIDCGTNNDLYDLNTSVFYVKDDDITVSVDNNLTDSSNSKRIIIKVNYSQTYPKQDYRGDCITQISYTTYNVGQIQVNKRAW